MSESPLTPYQHRILVLIADGRSNAFIGHTLDISEDAVKDRVRWIFRKLDARDRAHAVAIGFLLGLLKVESP